MLREPACRDSAINVRPLKHAIVRAANRNKERVVERESDIQNFAGVTGVALAFAALRHARIAVKLHLHQRAVMFGDSDVVRKLSE